MERLLEIRESMPAVYLTLMSMLEAIALETLIEKSINLSAAGGTTLGWTQVVVLLVTIVYIWVTYSQGVLAVRWIVGSLDAIFPFGVAILQFVAIAMIGNENLTWWFALFSLGFAGAAGNFHRSYRLAAHDPKNELVVARVALPEVIASNLLVAGLSLGLAAMAGLGWLGGGTATAGVVALGIAIAGASAVWQRQWRRMTAAA